MNSKRTYSLMLATVGLLVLAIFGGAYASKQILTTKSMNLVTLKAELEGYNQQRLSFIQAKKDIQTYDELYNIAKVIVPENKNQAETVRQIVKLAQNNSVKIGSISFPTSTLGNGAAATSTQPTLGLRTPTVTAGNPDLSQLTAVVGSAGVYVLQINVASDSSQPASYPQLISFLSALENNRLTAEVTSVNITPDSTVSDRFSFTLDLNTYIKP